MTVARRGPAATGSASSTSSRRCWARRSSGGRSIGRTSLATGLRGEVADLHDALVCADDALDAETRLAFVVERIRASFGIDGTPTADPAPPDAAEALRAFLDAHLFDPVTLAAASTAIRATPTQAARAFTAAFGISPHVYVTGRRLDAARARILDGEPLADVAASVGFYDQAHLTRHFKRFLGVTPGRFVEPLISRPMIAAMASGNSTDVAARAALVAGAAALAHGDDLALGLRTLLDAVARPLGIASAAIVVRDGSGTGLEIVASYGLDAAATAGLAEAMQRPTHPVTMTFEATAPTYDVAPMNPGGPRLRSHLPLIVTRGRTPRVLGVLALAHDDEIAPDAKPIIGAAADLAAARIERQLSGQ